MCSPFKLRFLVRAGLNNFSAFLKLAVVSVFIFVLPRQQLTFVSACPNWWEGPLKFKIRLIMILKNILLRKNFKRYASWKGIAQLKGIFETFVEWKVLWSVCVQNALSNKSQKSLVREWLTISSGLIWRSKKNIFSRFFLDRFKLIGQNYLQGDRIIS